MMARSTPLSRFNNRKAISALWALVAVVLAFVFGPAAAWAEDGLPPPGHLTDAPSAPVPPPGSDPLPAPGKLIDAPADVGGGTEIQPAMLQLEVLLNGYKINMVAGFNKLDDGGLSSARSELRDIGIKVPGQGKDEEQVALSAIPGLTYKFDEPTLTIDITAPDSDRIPKAYDIVPKQDMLAAEGGYGAVLNYSAYAAAASSTTAISPQFTGASINLDMRAYAPFGVLQQTGIVSTVSGTEANAIRLDTTWTTSSQSRAETYRAGDFISGALSWTRPVRMGGISGQRDFRTRPDIVTTPLASMQGSAAVPSTLDVYINGAKSFSEQVSQGPFEINRLPMISSQGDAEIVLTDTAGQKTTVNVPLYSSALLLAPHMFDYSVDLGIARRNYGLESFDYGNEPMLIASARYGVNKNFTAEAHVEGKEDLAEGGLGAVFQAGKIGTFNAAIAASDYRGSMGLFAFASWNWQNDSLMLHASSQRTFGDFNDLAAVTAMQNIVPGTDVISAAVPKAIDQINASYSFKDQGLAVGAGLTHYVPASGAESLMASISATKNVGRNISVFANAYYDAFQNNNWGFGVGMTMPLGGSDKNITAASGAGYDHVNGTVVQASVIKPIDSAYGSYGWAANAIDANGVAGLSASGMYRNSHALLTADVRGNTYAVTGDARAEGSVIATKAGVFFGNPVQDAFAVVDTGGAENVRVEYENRYVGTTDKRGKLLLTNLQSYHPGKVSVDPKSLPLNSNLTETEKRVAAKNMSGVVVDFAVKKDTSSALVILKDKTGAFVPAGTLITLEGQADPFPMGYDGQVYITGLSPKNKVSAEVKGVPCSVSFDYKEDDTKQVLVGPLTCG